jgi:hypothetical protein
MSGVYDPSLPEASYSDSDLSGLRRGRFSYLPVVPGRLEFAAEVRRRILATHPDVVAIELPATLEEVYLQAIGRLPQMSVIFYRDTEYHRDSEGPRSVYVPVEPADPFVEAIRTARETGAEVVFADPDSTERPHIPDSYPDSYALNTLSYTRYVDAYRLYPQPRTPEIERYAEGIAWKLQGANPQANVLIVLSLNLLDPVLDAMERPQSEPDRRVREELQLVNPHPDCLGEITLEYPYLQDRYETFRGDLPNTDAPCPDRRRVQFALLREAEQNYEINTGDKMHVWQRRLLARYCRNLAVMNQDLVASLYDITISARSIVDENYAWEVWEMASRYSSQQTSTDIETVNISGDEVWLDTRRIRLRRRLPSTKRRMGNMGLKRRKKEKVPGEWAAQLDGNNICSYPPEDLVIEGFGRFLKKKGKSILSEERSTVEPFTSSLLDGIDLRETIRNWHDGKIFVRNLQKIQGEVGSVIVIFDEGSGDDDKYNYMTTWLGEHQNESDMAFYSTFPFDHLVGPGIGRAEYGGFLMSLPARRMYDVWADPDYSLAETKAERLLLAGMDYSIQKYVVYVAAKPPRSIFRNIAARFERTIVYIPIGQLSPVTMKKLRVVHVLDGYDKREAARDYIW